MEPFSLKLIPFLRSCQAAEDVYQKTLTRVFLSIIESAPLLALKRPAQ
jgi:DNA-directed RNA polymerase specialized sigma24 family protein